MSVNDARSADVLRPVVMCRIWVLTQPPSARHRVLMDRPRGLRNGSRRRWCSAILLREEACVCLSHGIWGLGMDFAQAVPYDTVCAKCEQLNQSSRIFAALLLTT